MRSFLRSCIKVRESTCLRVSHEEKIAHLALVLACYELKQNATAEKKPHPSWRQSPAVRTAIPKMEEVGFCTKSPATLLPTSWRESWTTCQPRVNIPVSLKRVFVTCFWNGGLKKPHHTSLTEINPMNCSYAGG